MDNIKLWTRQKTLKPLDGRRQISAVARGVGQATSVFILLYITAVADPGWKGLERLKPRFNYCTFNDSFGLISLFVVT